MKKITPRQQRILEFIQENQKKQGYPPSLREIGRRFGIASTNGVRYHLEALEAAGWLKRQEYTSRGIQVTGSGAGTGVPLLGRVPAGPLNLAVEEVEREVEFDRGLFGAGESDELFCLRVEGDSMKDAGIVEGDWVVVRRGGEARPGQIVVARVGEEATIKRLMKEKDRVLLCPENPAYQPIEVTPGREEAEGFQILGVVAGLIRTSMG